LRFSAQTSPLRKSTLAAKDEFHALCVIPAGSERGFFTTPRLVIVALRHNTALHAAMLPQRWSNLCAGGHSFRSVEGIAFAGEFAQQPFLHAAVEG
jgi:hypothetical protein